MAEVIEGADLYTRLREFLDRLPGGFPATDTGVEVKILKKLFTPSSGNQRPGLSPVHWVSRAATYPAG